MTVKRYVGSHLSVTTPCRNRQRPVCSHLSSKMEEERISQTSEIQIMSTRSHHPAIGSTSVNLLISPGFWQEICVNCILQCYLCPIAIGSLCIKRC